MPNPSPDCGSNKGYFAHLGRDEAACDACRNAHTQACKKPVEIRRRAVKELISRYKPEFAAIKAKHSAIYDKEQADAAWAAVFEEVASADQA